MVYLWVDTPGFNNHCTGIVRKLRSSRNEALHIFSNLTKCANAVHSMSRSKCLHSVARVKIWVSCQAILSNKCGIHSVVACRLSEAYPLYQKTGTPVSMFAIIWPTVTFSSSLTCDQCQYQYDVAHNCKHHLTTSADANQLAASWLGTVAAQYLAEMELDGQTAS